MVQYNLVRIIVRWNYFLINLLEVVRKWKRNFIWQMGVESCDLLYLKSAILTIFCQIVGGFGFKLFFFLSLDLNRQGIWVN